ncbi:helix-turn-helix transcriptional regulator [Halonotius pteroides]|uniref:Uncharacterized protein n=1 Tax=Halonotius pteroides TaxID=268735 RepID=A0A3A6Q513_9EURY|nr:hypothetical protein [Halonotius pteroides]RJX51451.1 hypothetical protein DP106_01795 [Halonotius pteroides]
MPRSASLDLADVLLKRCECLRALSNQPQAKRELVESLDIPRSTLDDIVRDLEHADLVEYLDGEWQPTPLGQCTFNHHTRYKEGLESLTDAAPVINELPRTTPVDRHFLIDAEVHIATAPVPDDVIQILLNAVESATHIRGITALAMSGYADSFYRHATAGSDAQLELVLQPEIFERLRTINPNQTDNVLSDENTTLYHGDVPVSFSLWISDENHAGIIVHTDQSVKGIIINDTDDALDWATDQYNRVREDAELISKL